jgi:predicted small secreted protein
MKRLASALALLAAASLAACDGPAEKAGKDRDKVAAAANGLPYEGDGPNEKLGAAQDRATTAATRARDAEAAELKQQADNIRKEADDRADKLDAQAKATRDDADTRADAIDARAKAVRQ